ncbi:MAG: PIN domain-containing protein [Acidobacteria bacterium]|nr:PIN domain-containing protein [Acidobacteriota bacterium]
MIYLLDANVLLARHWKPHRHHPSVRHWFDSAVTEWATTPVTQAAFVRLLSIHAITGGTITPGRAMDALQYDLDAPNHVFWPADIAFVEPVRAACNTLIGPKQATDAYLVALALRHGGKLATLDRGVLELVRGRPGEEAVELIELPAEPQGVQ